MPQLRINLLGPPSVFWDAAPVHVPRKMLRAMLYYLACQPNGVGRGELCDLFWTNQHPDSETRALLRTSLAKLRSALPEPGLLVAQQDRVSLDFSRVLVDTVVFRELGMGSFKASQQFPVNQPLPEAITTQIVRAATLWRGPHFLAGANLPSSPAFDRWLVNYGSTLESARQLLIQRMADHSEAAGDLEAAVMWARLFLQQTDDPAEPLQARLISWLVDLGRRSEAQSYVTRLQAHFTIEGAGPPPPELAAAFARLRQARQAPALESNSLWLLDLPSGTPFAGRDALLNDLRLAFRRGGVVALSGEAGSGKTRLLNELYRSLESGSRLLLSRAGPALADLPFQPLVSALRSGVMEAEWRRLGPVWARQLARLLPELVRNLPEGPEAPGAPAEDARSLYEALYRLLLQLAQIRRVLFVLDNAHACDPPSLQALAYLVEQGFFASHGLLVVAYRPEEESAHLKEWLASLAPNPPLNRIELPPLGLADIRELAQSALQHPPSESLAQGLLRDTGGNPRFVIETLQAVLAYSTRQGNLEGLERLPVAGSLNALLRERLRRLNPATRPLVEMAAVLGSEFTLDQLEACVAVEPEELVQALEELEQAHLVVFTPELHPAGGYAFVHAQVPQALMLDLSPARLRLLHLRAARALEQHPGAGQARAAEMAQHYEAAGSLPAAAEAWLQAARYDLRLFSPVEAYRAFQRAEKLVMRLGDEAPESLLYRLYTAWGETAYNLNEGSVQQQVYSILLALGERRGSPLLIGSALSGLANTHFPDRADGQTLEKIDRALFYLRQAGSQRELVEALNRRGSLLLHLGQYQEAIRVFKQAAEAAGSDPDLMPAHFNAAFRADSSYRYLGLPAVMHDSAQITLAEAERLGFTPGAALAHMVIGEAENFLGHFQSALQHFKVGRQLAEAAQLAVPSGFMRMVATQAEANLGHLDESWEYIQEMLEIGRRLSSAGILLQAYFSLGFLYFFLGEYGAAEAAFRQAASGNPSPYERMNLDFVLTMLEGYTGDPHLALARLDALIAESQQAELGYVSMPAMLERAGLLVRLGLLDQAQAEVEWLGRELELRGQRIYLLLSQLLLAEITWRQGRADQASQMAAQALSRGHDMGHVWAELRALALLRQITGSQDGMERSARLLEEMGRHACRPEISALYVRFRDAALGQGAA